MISKNRFSILLEQLLNTSDIKQYTLAKYLNYDTSYISKWLTGRMLPGEKGVDDVLHSISNCIIENGCEEGLQTLANGYQLQDISELGTAIYDQLVVEYNYVITISSLTGYDVAPELIMFPEVSIADFLRRMRHPILRRITNLRIAAAADVMALNHEYQLEFNNIRLEKKEEEREYPNVNYDLIIDLHHEDRGSVLARIQLLTNLMLRMAHISAHIYGSEFARGKLIFSVRDEFCISGMLNGPDRCISVIMCEGERHTKDMYRVISSVCTKDNLYFVPKDMKEAIVNREYLQMILSPGQRWLFGRLTEYLLPEDLIQELIDENPIDDDRVIPAMINKLAALISGVKKSNKIQILIYENTLLDFALYGSIDFIDKRIELNYEQRRRVLDFLLQLIENENIDLRLIHGLLPDQVEFLTLPTLYISDATSYLKIFSNNLQESRLFQINRMELAGMYQKYFAEIQSLDAVISDKDYIRNYFNQLQVNVQLLDYTNSI